MLQSLIRFFSYITGLGNPNPAKDAAFGTSVAGIGDMNGDGIRDLIVGAPGPRQGLRLLRQGSKRPPDGQRSRRTLDTSSDFRLLMSAIGMVTALTISPSVLPACPE